MYFLYTVQAVSMYLDPMDLNYQEKRSKLPQDLVMIGQAPDCTSYLVLSKAPHEILVRQTSIPEGYDFIFRQSWGLTINEEIIHRTIATLRAEAYPPMADYLDAKVKGDAAQEAAYVAACLNVKEKYPHFSLT